MQEGIFLKGLKELVESINVNMNKLVKSLVKDEGGNDTSEARPRTETRVARVTKPARVPTWTKKMSLETYMKQLTTWS